MRARTSVRNKCYIFDNVYYVATGTPLAPTRRKGGNMSQLSYLLDRARDSAETGKKQERRSRSRLRNGLRKLPLTSYRRVVDASLAQSLTALRSWLTRRLQQGEAHAELRRE